MYLEKLFNLKGKVVAVIGAGGHLCSRNGKSFARVGCKIVLLDLRIEKAKKIERLINNEGYKADIIIRIKCGLKKHIKKH